MFSDSINDAVRREVELNTTWETKPDLRIDKRHDLYARTTENRG